MSAQNILIRFCVILLLVLCDLPGQPLTISQSGVLEKQGLSVIVLNDIYPEGHQGGITVIQHGRRVAANGNLSLQPTPGQWQPYPALLDKEIKPSENMIIASLKFPDSSRILTENQPIIYPDLEFTYRLNVYPEGEGFRITADLDQPLPEKWIGKVGFILELYPADLFGKTYQLGSQSGIFPRYATSPVMPDDDDEFEAVPLAKGRELVVAPEDEHYRMTITDNQGELQLIDGRVKHNNGWFVVRSLIPAGSARNAIDWTVKPHVIKGWIYKPVIHTSQVGYHPKQPKIAVIELDKNDTKVQKAEVRMILPSGGFKVVREISPERSADFLRYGYLKADFSDVTEPGMYIVHYGQSDSGPFRIGSDIYKNGVWQPTLEFFLPVQMCHMKIFEKYRVWHDRCHLDDALMAPANINHFDTYAHGEIPDGFEALKHVKGLNQGGWHDAGDYDLRIESQIGTILTLAYAWEEFNLTHDQTLISQEEQLVEIHHPDGKPDVLQQIEHGLLTVIGGYRQFDRLYRGILCPTLRQYAMLGEAADMTDNIVYSGPLPQTYTGFWYDQITNKYDKYFSPQMNRPSVREFVKDLDDRLVFMEDNPSRQLYGATGLAAAARVLRGYNDSLSVACIGIAEDLWIKFSAAGSERMTNSKVQALVELILTTGKTEYRQELINMLPAIRKNIQNVAWMLGRVMHKIEDKEFVSAINEDILQVKEKVENASKENPFGIPYHPEIWGAGWTIQNVGYRHYFLYKGWPKVFSPDQLFNALNFVLGCHPGENTSSFVSAVGAKSQIIAYGMNRGDWSFIPGGVISGTNLVRPDLPELKEWPFLWQQAEYVIGGGASHFMFMALGADKILNQE